MGCLPLRQGGVEEVSIRHEKNKVSLAQGERVFEWRTQQAKQPRKQKQNMQSDHIQVVITAGGYNNLVKQWKGCKMS